MPRRDRVKQAEADFTTASEGITDQTPLAEAGAQFNSAAFSLQVAWMRVYVDAGCLSEEQQVQAQTAVHDYTADLQTSLRTAGFYDGKIDGVYGPGTVDAVKALQKESGLPETGFVDRATAAALDAAVVAKQSSTASEAVATAAAVQSTLKLAGHWDGPVDGQWTEELTDALKAFQTELGGDAVRGSGRRNAQRPPAHDRGRQERGHLDHGAAHHRTLGDDRSTHHDADVTVSPRRDDSDGCGRGLQR